MTFTGAIGAAFMLPLRAIINTAVALGIHPNVLTLIGVLINVVAAFFLATDQFITAWSFVHAILAAVANAGNRKDPAQVPCALRERVFRPSCHAPATCADIARRSSRRPLALRLVY